MKGGPLLGTGTDVKVFEQASVERLEDSEALFAMGRYASAIVMGIYALEIRLKILICRRLDLEDLPRAFEIHNLDELMLLTGLSNKITRVKRPRDVPKNWDELRKLSKRVNELRYSSAPDCDRTAAELVLKQLRGHPGGVLLWLANQT